MDSCSSDDEETTKKYAIVIANSKYDEDAVQASEPSKNWTGSPSFDARMMLRKLGLRNFDVSDFHDQTGEALKKTFSDFVAAFHGRQLKSTAEKESLLLYFSGLGIVKEGKMHILGTDGTLVDIEGFFTGALDATSKVKGNSIVTLLDGSFSNLDSEPCPLVSFVAKDSDGGETRPKVVKSANGNLLLCGMGQVNETSSSGESTPVVEPRVPEQAMSLKGSLSRTMSSSARRFWSTNMSGSTTARNFNPNLDRFCSLLDKMETTPPESESVMKTDADPHVIKAAIASRIKDVVSTKASLAQQYKTSTSRPTGATSSTTAGDNTVNQNFSSSSLSSNSEKSTGQKRAIEVPKLKQISSTTARYHAKQTPRGNRTARAAVAGDHAPLGERKTNRTRVEDVASLCAYLQENDEPSFLSLKGTMLSMPTGSPGALERWSNTDSWLNRQEVSQEAVERGLYSLTTLDGPGTICALSGSDLTLINMQICLTDEKGKQSIVLDESCTDVKIQDSIFEGGTLILSGAGCHVRFSNSSFHFCTLVVRDGAVAELKGTRFESGLSDGAGICLVATGLGSKVQATDCEVTGGYQAVLVKDGASLDATRLVCNGAPVNGVEARGQGSKISMTECTVAGCMYNAVMVVDGATGSLQNSVLQGSVLRDGLTVAGKGTSMCVRNCELRDNANSGARVCASASVHVLDSFSHGNKKTGFRAQEGGHLTIRDSFSERDKCACTSEGASSVVDGYNFQVNNTTLGFSVLQGACMKLYRCSVKTVDGRGVYVHAGKISINEGKVEGCTQVAVVVRGGGEAILETVEARQNAGGAFQCSNAGSLMCLTRCKTTDRRPYKKSSNGTIIAEDCEPNLNPDGSITPSAQL